MEVECIEDGHKLVELDARRTPGLETNDELAGHAGTFRQFPLGSTRLLARGTYGIAHLTRYGYRLHDSLPAFIGRLRRQASSQTSQKSFAEDQPSE